ncbi:hypothetical protein TSAR_010625 [Trichomalopsis sarcophagae]|uniref:Uncharacterized protein n=1 Tax=Trichomalopsis sarcophagae TaxID=543379 RepID=A0A232ER01_9HYME|nr:hypothetical protein TSAR_010625 [Trichomalopsis sarcophagae]
MQKMIMQYFLLHNSTVLLGEYKCFSVSGAQICLIIIIVLIKS